MNRYAEKYAESTGDHDYLAAIKLFIAEEQRHARDIARFLEQKQHTNNQLDVITNFFNYF